jgi:hypothetical protein
LAMIEKVKAKGRHDLLPKYHTVAVLHNQYIKELYEDLPTTKNWKEVDPKTVTGQIIEIYRGITSSQKGSIVNEIQSFAQDFTKLLYEVRAELQSCQIDLSKAFGPLYPDTSIPPGC